MSTKNSAHAYMQRIGDHRFMEDAFQKIFRPEALEELITHLRNLITIYTTNPSGNEIAAARYIADVFKRENLEATIFEPEKVLNSVSKSGLRLASITF